MEQPRRDDAVDRYGMSTAAVRRATGRTHEEWFALLDDAGAASRSHGDIAASLVDQHGVAGWWAQHVTVAYERARGLRVKHQTPSGFAASKTRTVAAPVAQVFHAFVDEATRRRWLDADLEITSTAPDRSVNGRIGDSRLSVGLTAKGEARTQVAVQQHRLADAQAAERAKSDWAARLERLADLVT